MHMPRYVARLVSALQAGSIVGHTHTMSTSDHGDDVETVGSETGGAPTGAVPACRSASCGVVTDLQFGVASGRLFRQSAYLRERPDLNRPIVVRTE